MEHEPKEINPYMGLTDDELYIIIRDIQAEQRGINDRLMLIEKALMENYVRRLKNGG